MAIIDNFYLFHEREGRNALDRGCINLAREHYSRSLMLNPANFWLISRVAKHIYENPEFYPLADLLNDAVSNALRFLGDSRNVFDLTGVASILQSRIIRSEIACNLSTQFDLQDRAILNVNLCDLTSQKPLRRFVLLTCVWKRPALTEIVLAYYQELKARLADKLDLVLLAVGSEGCSSRQLCEGNGFDYLEFPNHPLSAKWEQGLKHCRTYRPDGVVITGSDDLLSESLFLGYCSMLDKGVLFCGFTDGIFLDLQSPAESVRWRGYGGRTVEYGMPWRLNETIGMGRFFSKPLLEHLDYSLWAGEPINKGLDARAKERLRGLGMHPVLEGDEVPICLNGQLYAFGQLAIQMDRFDGLAVDIKLPNQNITTLEKYKLSPDSFEYLQDTWVLLGSYFPDETVRALKQLAVKSNVM